MRPLSVGLLSLPRPGSETDVPLVASSTGVSMVPRAHGVVTKEKPPAATGPLSRTWVSNPLLSKRRQPCAWWRGLVVAQPMCAQGFTMAPAGPPTCAKESPKTGG
jgi:hypothetical protein